MSEIFDENKPGRANFGWVPKVLKYVIPVIIVLILFFSSFYRVSEQENAVVTMFGKVVQTHSAGLYLKIPFLQKVQIVDITTHGVGVGYSVKGNGQNIANKSDGVMITSDFNLLNIDFYMEYKVVDPVAFLYHCDRPEEILSNIALAAIRSVVVNYTVDEAMTTAKGQIQSEIKSIIVDALAERETGLSLLNITIQDSQPPTDEIIAAFKSVETAKQGADTAKNNALKYQNEQIPLADAKADQIVQSATAEKQARIAEAEGQVARFEKMFNEYKNYPLVTKKRMFFETMETILPDLKVIITDGQTETLLPLDSFTGVNTNTGKGE